MSCKQRALIFRNPYGLLVLVAEGDRIVKATCSDYIGESVGSAVLGAISVMRWEEGFACQYPDMYELNEQGEWAEL